MKIKGTSLLNTLEFVKNNFTDRTDEWLDSLPEESANIYKNPIFTSNWYILKEGQIIPIIKIAELFYDNDIKKAAYQLGYAGALLALKGIYKIFVKVASVEFVLKRATSIFSTYYLGGEIEIIEYNDKKIVLDVVGFTEGEEIMFENITGWLAGMLSIISNKKYNISYKYDTLENNILDCKIFLETV